MKTVASIMRTGVPSVTPDATVKEVLSAMQKHDCFGLVVEDRGEIVGIITDSDLLSAYCRYIGGFSYEEEKDNPRFKKRLSEYRELKAKDLMTTRPKTIDQHDSIAHAADMIKIRKHRRLIVVDENKKYIGFINRVTIIKSALE